jgi:Zn-dependent protease/CBS domain-containing protein
LLLIVPYLAATFSVQFASVARIAGVRHGELLLPPLVWGAILAVGLFASVTLHEFSHSVLAVRFGGRVRAVTLMLLGGVSEMTQMPRRPRQEALMALAGPGTSLLLGALLFLIFRAASTAPADVKLGAFYLGYMNLVLGVFNLVPAFPMDGGRILRALLASRLGAARATRVAARVGRYAALLMGLFGLWSTNYLLILVAIFVYFGAGAELAGEQVRQALEGLQVADLLPAIRRPPATVPEDAPLSEVLPRMHEVGRLELIVTDGDSTPVAIIRAADLVGLGAGDRSRLRVRDLAAYAVARYVIASWDERLNAALDRATSEHALYLIVTDPHSPSAHGLVGLVAAADIQTFLTLRMAETQNPSASVRQGPFPTS